MTKTEETKNSNGTELSSALLSNCCERNFRTEPRLELRGLLKQDQEQD